MSNTHIIFNGSKAKKPDAFKSIEKGACGLCGAINQELDEKKNYVSSGFTNNDIFKNNYICPACAYVLSARDYRVSSFLATNQEIIFLKKDQIEDLIFNLDKRIITTPFIFCITTSYKKHLSFFAEENYSIDKYSVRFDNLNIFINKKEHLELYKNMREIYNFFPKVNVLNADYNYNCLKKSGWTISELEKLEGRIKRYRGSSIFNFLVYAMNPVNKDSKDENKEGK